VGALLSDPLRLARPARYAVLSSTERTRVRRLAFLAVLAQLVFVAGWIAGWMLEANYSPVRDYVSELGRLHDAQAWTFQIPVIVWGAGFVALAAGLTPVLRGRPWARATPALLLLAGVCAVLFAVFRLDCADTISHTCKQLREAGSLSWHDYAHGWDALALEIVLWLTPFALARAVWTGRVAWLLLAGGVAIGAVDVVVYATGAATGSDAGLVQRLLLGVVHAWVLILAAVLIAAARRTTPPPHTRQSRTGTPNRQTRPIPGAAGAPSKQSLGVANPADQARPR
jgi:hypothetical protein